MARKHEKKRESLNKQNGWQDLALIERGKRGRCAPPFETTFAIQHQRAATYAIYSEKAAFQRQIGQQVLSIDKALHARWNTQV